MLKNKFYKWIFYTLIFEFVFWCILFVLFISYYDNLTKTSSKVQAFDNNLKNKIYLSAQKEASNKTKTRISDDKAYYDWVFGKIIVFNKKNNNWLVFSQNSKTLIKIDLKRVYSYLVVSKLLDKNLIDNNVARYLLNSDNFEQDLLNIIFLSQYSTKINWNDIPDKKILDTYKSLIKNWMYKELITTLKNLELITDFQLKKVNRNLTLVQPWMWSESWLYIKNKFLIDDQNKYKKDINLVSNLLWLDPVLLKSAIITEQVRGFFTYRWVAKKIIFDNFGIMRMGQWSYWIWWVKLLTAKKLLTFAKSHLPQVYNKYLSQYNWTDETLLKLLQDRDNYFYQILFAWLTLKEILRSWNMQWYDISNRPWIILTLYNIWNKQANANPKIWWANIKINWIDYSFGSLWMLLYYYQKCY